MRKSHKQLREEKMIGKFADVEDKYNGVRYTVQIQKRALNSQDKTEHWLVKPVQGEGEMYKRVEHLHNVRNII